MRIVSWFSCGTASAVNTKLTIARYHNHEVTIARCIVAEEHPDNDRFAADCARWFGQPVINLRSTEYANCEDVWTRRKFMSGPHGAVCTIEMKKAVRWAFEREWKPDMQAFGFTADEEHRAKRMRLDNPDMQMLTLLIEQGLSKEDCHAIVERAGIVRPMMYRLGFQNANCIGCVNAQSPKYWNRVRRYFPDVFHARATLSRSLGVRLVKGTSGDRERIYLDELDPMLVDDEPEQNVECGLLCYIAEQKIEDVQ